MKIKTILIILNVAGLICSLIWLMKDQGWEPLVTSIGLIAVLMAQIFNKSGGSKTKMVQKGGKGSTNYQSKGNITIKKK